VVPLKKRKNSMKRSASLLLFLLLLAAPAFGQIDLAGEWNNIAFEDQADRRGGPELGDYTGFPLNDAARLRADSWMASIWSLPEWQCRPHPADYITVGPSTLHIWKELTPLTRQVVAWHMEWLRSKERVIYMDGRPHPSEDAVHTWGGFSTGKWQGDVLTITTTHLKEGYLRRNGVPRSDLATMTEHLVRHGDYLQWITIIYDPVYLTQPFIRTTEYSLNLRGELEPNPCSAEDVGPETNVAKGAVPHHLPGTNTAVKEFASRHHVPEEAAKGSAETLYPDYRFKAVVPALAADVRRDLSRPGAPARANADVHVLQVRGNLHMITGAGGNISMLVGPDNVLLVDTGDGRMTDKVLAAVRGITDKSIRYIVNTNSRTDHVGGNDKAAAAGKTITGGVPISDAAEGAAVIAHENVLARLSSVRPSLPFRALPTNTYVNEWKKLSPSIHGEGIQIFHEPGAVTDGDSIVLFRGSDAISTGDIFTTTKYPMIDLAKGGSIQGLLNAVNHVLDLAIPDYWMEGGTLIIPGEGRLCDSADVAYYRDMLTIIRDRIQDMIRKGMTLEQVKAARPTRDYDPRYGATTGSWTTDMFVEAVYRSLVAQK
jgi:glyoxylase-like metal-dependent hydrolase (beta-lactamase superfamily II)